MTRAKNSGSFANRSVTSSFIFIFPETDLAPPRICMWWFPPSGDSELARRCLRAWTKNLPAKVWI